MIARSFEKCCIINAMDGTKDDAVFDENGDYDKLDTAILILMYR